MDAANAPRRSASEPRAGDVPDTLRRRPAARGAPRGDAGRPGRTDAGRAERRTDRRRSAGPRTLDSRRLPGDPAPAERRPRGDPGSARPLSRFMEPLVPPRVGTGLVAQGLRRVASHVRRHGRAACPGLSRPDAAPRTDPSTTPRRVSAALLPAPRTANGPARARRHGRPTFDWLVATHSVAPMPRISLHTRSRGHDRGDPDRRPPAACPRRHRDTGRLHRPRPSPVPRPRSG